MKRRGLSTLARLFLIQILTLTYFGQSPCTRVLGNMQLDIPLGLIRPKGSRIPVVIQQ